MRCIDGDALDEVLEKIPAADIKNIDGQAYVLVRLSQVFNVIEHAPTIEPERKKGKWTLLPNGDAICQECKHVQKSAWDMDGLDNFCHHCGADMREPEDIPMEYYESGGR